jgi:hypothetical protein
MDTDSFSLHSLTFVDEGEDVLIGRPEIESFALFPPDGAELVRHLQAGATVKQASDWYLATYGEEADVADVVQTLRTLGFIRADSETETVSAPVRWRRLGSALLSPVALCCYLALGVTTCYLEVRDPVLRPDSGGLFTGGSLLLIGFAVYVAQFAGLYLHEGFHVLAGRRLGVGSRLGIGRRLYFIVFQTTMTGLMAVPPGKRILPFCAGLLADAINYCLMVLIADACGSTTFAGRFALALAYVTLIRMSWQFMIFMETDVYYVFATITHCPNLRRLAIARLRTIVGRAPLETRWTERERRIVRWYLPFVVVGSAVMIAVGVLLVVPAMAQFGDRLVDGIADGDRFGPQFWNSAATSGLLALQVAALIVIVIRDRTARSRRPLRQGSDPL